MSDAQQVFRDMVREGAGKVDWGRLIWLADQASAGVGVTVGYVEIQPDTGNPLHRHHTCSEVIFVIEGTIDHVVGDDSVVLTPGDVLVVPPGVAHGASNIGPATARMVVVYDKGERDFEVVR